MRYDILFLNHFFGSCALAFIVLRNFKDGIKIKKCFLCYDVLECLSFHIIHHILLKQKKKYLKAINNLLSGLLEKVS